MCQRGRVRSLAGAFLCKHFRFSNGTGLRKSKDFQSCISSFSPPSEKQPTKEEKYHAAAG
jgi:hypothetical protein